MRAIGIINALTRGGALVFEAIYLPSYRHNAYRVRSVVDPTAPMYPSEAAALQALKGQAIVDGSEICVEVGSYVNKARQHGERIYP